VLGVAQISKSLSIYKIRTFIVGCAVRGVVSPDKFLGVSRKRCIAMAVARNKRRQQQAYVQMKGNFFTEIPN